MTSFQRKTGLGKGLSALLDDSDTVNPPKNGVNPVSEAKHETHNNSIGLINISDVETNPYQPRTEFDQVALNELAESIKVQRPYPAHYRSQTHRRQVPADFR